MARSSTSISTLIRGTKVAAFLCVATLSLAPAADAAAPVMPSAPKASGMDQSLAALSDAYLNAEIRTRHDAALKFVSATGITRNLSLLLLHDVKDEAPVQAAIRRYGMDKVQDTVVRAIRTAQNAYANDWNQMLAEIYEAHFTASELQSLRLERDASPYFIRLIDLQDEIATAVKVKGSTIFAQARTDVMARLSVALPV